MHFTVPRGLWCVIDYADSDCYSSCSSTSTSTKSSSSKRSCSIDYYAMIFYYTFTQPTGRKYLNLSESLLYYFTDAGSSDSVDSPEHRE